MPVLEASLPEGCGHDLEEEIEPSVLNNKKNCHLYYTKWILCVSMHSIHVSSKTFPHIYKKSMFNMKLLCGHTFQLVLEKQFIISYACYKKVQ